MARSDGRCDAYDCPYAGLYTVPGHKDKLYCRPHRTSLFLDLSEKEVKKLKAYTKHVEECIGYGKIPMYYKPFMQEKL